MSLIGNIKKRLLAKPERNMRDLWIKAEAESLAISNKMRRISLESNILFRRHPGTDPDSDITVAIFAGRSDIDTVALTVEALMEQTVLAGKIILYLPESEREYLPASLHILQNRGLELCFHPDDNVPAPPHGAIITGPSDLPDLSFISTYAETGQTRHNNNY